MTDSTDNTDLIFSQASKDLRPDLTMYGIEEIDRGICEDSYENRSILRVNRLNWQTIYDDNGEASPYIEVMSQEMKAAKSLASLEDRRAIMVDDRNNNSDYLTEEALLIEEKSDSLVPLWVLAATRTWIRVREARAAGDVNKMKLLAGPPQRCRYIKSDGLRCQLWSTNRVTDDELCRTHLGSKHNNLTGAVQRARERAYQAAPTAIQLLEQLMESAESEPVKLKAATEILDRAGVRGGIEIDARVQVDVIPAAQILQDRLAKLRDNQLENRRALEELIISADEQEQEEDESRDDDIRPDRISEVERDANDVTPVPVPLNHAPPPMTHEEIHDKKKRNS
ncbi:MAG: hypothetical protein ACRC5T_04305 [Cetobacterium sp.]